MNSTATPAVRPVRPSVLLVTFTNVTMTEKGLTAGVAVEGFDWLVGDKPSTKALYLRDTLCMVLRD